MIYDVTYMMDEDMAIFPGDPKYHIERKKSISAASVCNLSEVRFGTHTGTHIDAPLHFFKDGMDVSRLPLQQLYGKTKVIEIADFDLVDHKIDINAVEHAGIESNDIVFLKTSNVYRFAGVNVLGDFNELTVGAAKYLVSLPIKLIGFDYMTIEKVAVDRVSAHEIFLSKQIPIIESLDLRNIVPGVYEAFCFPLKLANADGSPLRVVLKDFSADLIHD